MLSRAKRLILALIWLNFIISICFGLEITIKAVAYGLRRAFSQVNWVIKIEFFYQPLLLCLWFLFVAGTSKDDSYSLEVNIFSLGILLRSLRVVSVLNEITLWRNFVRTMRALVKPAFNFAVTLYSLYLIFASIGLEFMGGRISVDVVAQLQQLDSEVSDTWVYLNFNDFVMSLNTLFGIMWQNDWEQLVVFYEMLFNHERDSVVNMYFIVFIELANLIFINIIIAFIIDTYQSIDLTLKAERDAKDKKQTNQVDTPG